MPTLFDSNYNYDSIETYDYQIDYRMIRKDLFAVRSADNVFNCRAIDTQNHAVDLQEFELECTILEYSSCSNSYPATVIKVIPTEGSFQILIDDTTKLDRPRYVYHVFAVNGPTRIMLQQGQLLIE